MKNEELKDLLYREIEANIDSWELRNILILFKSSGGFQNDATDILRDIIQHYRSLGDTKKRDNATELIEFVTGDCSPHARIW